MLCYVLCTSNAHPFTHLRSWPEKNSISFLTYFEQFKQFWNTYSHSKMLSLLSFIITTQKYPWSTSGVHRWYERRWTPGRVIALDQITKMLSCYLKKFTKYLLKLFLAKVFRFSFLKITSAGRAMLKIVEDIKLIIKYFSVSMFGWLMPTKMTTKMIIDMKPKLLKVRMVYFFHGLCLASCCSWYDTILLESDGSLSVNHISGFITRFSGCGSSTKLQTLFVESASRIWMTMLLWEVAAFFPSWPFIVPIVESSVLVFVELEPPFLEYSS